MWRMLVPHTSAHPHPETTGRQSVSELATTGGGSGSAMGRGLVGSSRALTDRSFRVHEQDNRQIEVIIKIGSFICARHCSHCFRPCSRRPAERIARGDGRERECKMYGEQHGTRKNSQLDHVLYDSRLVPLDARVLQTGRSDHLPVLVLLTLAS